MRSKRWTADEGFTVSEVVLSAAIFFFVMTAILGLVGVSERMSVSAKQRAVVTNALAQYIDEIRSMNYDTIFVGSGGLPSTTSRTFGSNNEYSVTFSNRVVFLDGQNGAKLRTVNIRATCTVGNRTYTSTAVVHIKNPSDDTTVGTLVDPDAPIIEFSSPTPPSDSVLFGKWVYPAGTTANIATLVRSPNDLVAEVQYKVGAVLLRDSAGSSGSDAIFTFSPGYTSKTVSSDWDTTQAGVSDGFQTVTVISRDDQGRVSTLDRRFIVDNQVPGVPGIPQGWGETAYTGGLRFKAAPDGYQAYASRYLTSLYRATPSAGTPPTGWSLVATGTVASGPNVVAAVSNSGTITAPIALTPLSRYWATVIAGSPRDFNYAGVSSMTSPFVSRPALSDTSCTASVAIFTVGAKRVVYTTTLHVTRPTFAFLGSPVYTYERKQPGGAWQPYGAIATITQRGGYDEIVLKWTHTGSQTAYQYYYRVGVTVTPTGWGASGPIGPLMTNAAGLSPATSATNVPLNTTWTE